MTNQEAIEDIRNNIKPIVGGKSLDMAIEALEERKTGRWIDINGNGSLYECTQCHEMSCCKGKFCMDCGARMEESE